ncbi:MAG: hypothetical protein SCALA702_18710 [Melioribacteraceae bacterium]|nr:MAG: hypothetical protein SCALA702_18710 [Melioribacteraceae bacterium]
MDKPRKILVVDDQPENVHLLSDRLRKVGYEIESAYNGPTGIEKAMATIPDLILLDVMMPGMSGFEVCKNLSEKDETRDIPVILVTALTSPEDLKQGLQAGAFDYVKKPFNKVELLARINSALRFSETKKMLLEMEKANTFAATVVTANHEIKQPLTLINLSTAALRRQIGSTNYEKESLLKRVEIIENATRDIMDILEKLSMIKNPTITDYINNLKMIVLDNDISNSSIN